MAVPSKKTNILLLSVAGLSSLMIAGFPQQSLAQVIPPKISTPTPTVTTPPTAPPTTAPPATASPSATPQPTPGCLDDKQASLAIAGVLTREQTKQAVAWIKQGKKTDEILNELNLSGDQKRQLRTIGRQKCKK
jgi:hypothetical protein